MSTDESQPEGPASAEAEGQENMVPFPGIAQPEAAAPGQAMAPEQKALMGWMGVTLYLQSVALALRHVVLRAEIHPPSKGRHNERVLVFADRLTVLSDLMQQAPLMHEEAVAWWKEREDRLAQLEELPRIVAMVEREMGGGPERAKDLPALEKIEGMLTGLLGVVAGQKQIIERQEQALKVKIGGRN